MNATADPRFFPRRTSAPPAPATPWLLLWAALGSLALFPASRLAGGAEAGATLAFWLVGAPLIDLAFVERARIGRWMAALWHPARRTRRRRAAVRDQGRGPRRLPSMRRRNSAMMRR